MISWFVVAGGGLCLSVVLGYWRARGISRQPAELRHLWWLFASYVLAIQIGFFVVALPLGVWLLSADVTPFGALIFAACFCLPLSSLSAWLGNRLWWRWIPQTDAEKAHFK